MNSEPKTTVPQAGMSVTPNPATDSDRVRAPVVSAGPTDFGGGQAHDTTQEMVAEVARLASVTDIATSDAGTGCRTERSANERMDGWKHHMNILMRLSSKLMDKSQRSINERHRRLVTDALASFRSLQKLEGVDLETSSRVPVTLPEPLADKRKNMEVEHAPNVRLSQTPIGGGQQSKRKERSPISMDEEQPSKRAPTSEVQMPRAQQPQVADGSTEAQTPNWQTVVNKKKQEKKKKEKKKDEKKKPRTRPSALLISAKGSTSYADILRKVKQDLPENEAEGTIEKIRRTTTGQLLVVLNRNIGDKMGPLQSKIAEVLKEDAQVSCRTHQLDLEIRDIEETTTAEEVLAALKRESGEAQIMLGESLSLRTAYARTKTASIRLPAELAQRIVGVRGKIRIGLVNCSIREVHRPLKCYKCWHLGHIAAQCKSDVDRSKCCIKCGAEGHMVANCKNEARCLLCVERGIENGFSHVSGGTRCVVAMEERQAKKEKEKKR